MSLRIFKTRICRILPALAILLVFYFANAVNAELRFRVARRPSRMDRLKQRTEKYNKRIY